VGWGYCERLKDFQTGKAAMWISGNWEFANIKSGAPDMELGMFNFPSREGDVWASAAVGTVWSINKNSAHVDMTKKYLEFWAKAENQEVWAKSQSSFATNSKANPDLDNQLRNYRIYGSMLERLGLDQHPRRNCDGESKRVRAAVWTWMS